MATFNKFPFLTGQSSSDVFPPKPPATPEPPEWKVDRLVIDGVVVATAEMPERICSRPGYIPATVTNTGVVQTDCLSEATARVDKQFEAEYGAFAGEEIKRARETCQCGDGVNHSAYHSGHSPVSMYDAMVDSEVDRMMTALDPSPLDRALSDFIAKREAKREGHDYEMLEETLQQIVAEALARRNAEDAVGRPVARAFSLPISFTARLGMKTP